MRKLVWLCVAVVALSLSVFAQDSRDFPKAEVFGGYSYLHSSIVGVGFNSHGGSGSLSVNPTNWLGLVADVGGYHSSDNGLGVTTISYLFGPRFVARSSSPVTPFVQVLFGGVHSSASIGGASGSTNAFAMSAGGGLDVKVSPQVALRVIQAEYLFTKLNDGIDNHQNNVRVSAGIVFRFGGK